MKRRTALQAGIAAGAVALAGCTGGSDPAAVAPADAFADLYAPGPLGEERPVEGGVPIADLPALTGELTIYLGGGEGGVYLDFLDRLEQIYPAFSPQVREAPGADTANTILSEGTASPADVFWAVDAGSIGAVTDAGLTTTLPGAITDQVPTHYHPDDAWVATSGRARAIPYNTDLIDAADIPSSVMAFPEVPAFAEAMAWAPTYGSFQAFITTMRYLEGEDATRSWLEAVIDAGVTSFADEFLLNNGIADGTVSVGFANHYYAWRVREARPDAPIALAFTEGDAGALINVAGASVLRSSDRITQAERFIRHLLSTEAQEFFTVNLWDYPVLPEMEPVGDMPTIEELNPPEMPLERLSDIQPTLELLRSTGAL
jgi:ABC-type Fe3+ transport system, periplasmic component